jgi:hypothetical protein
VGFSSPHHKCFIIRNICWGENRRGGKDEEEGRNMNNEPRGKK